MGERLQPLWLLTVPPVPSVKRKGKVKRPNGLFGEVVTLRYAEALVYSVPEWLFASLLRRFSFLPQRIGPALV